MLFPTITFAIFFTLVLAVHTVLIDRPRPWRIAMLTASYVFYGWWDVRFLGLIIASSTLDFGAALAIERFRGHARPLAAKAALVVSLSANLAMLGFFKYADFFVESFVNLMADVGVTVDARPLGIILPVGISFFTFQSMSYTIDVYRGDLRASRSLLDFGLFVAFFPQLVAGPIVRARDFLHDLATDDRAPIEVSRALVLIAGGVFKKVVLADVVASGLVDDVFANPQGASALETLVGTYGYAVQIFCDFSGYSDIAIGLALLLGFRFPENFDQPYRSQSLQEFWRRWHISLSSWLRDYLYIGLGGNRRGRWKTYRNLMITMLLGGLWHGAGWNFVLWGALHGGGLAVERWWHERHPAPAQPSRTRRVLRTLATFHVVCLGWVFFRAASFGDAVDVLARLGSGWGEGFDVTGSVLLAIAAGLSIQFVRRGSATDLLGWVGRAPAVVQGAGFAVVMAVVGILAPDGVRPFIYFQF